MDRVDVLLVRFCPGSDDPVEALQRVFGISELLAREIEQTTPRIVRHGATKKVADQMVAALERIGAEVSCRPSRAVPPPSATEASEQAPPASATEAAVGVSWPPESSAFTPGSAREGAVGASLPPEPSTSTPAKPASGRRKGQAAPLKKRRDRSGPRRPSGGD